MSSINIENGQTINELATIENITTDSWFLVTAEGLTYNISLSNLRKQFVGDTAIELKNELFYSCAAIDIKLDEVRQLVLNGSSLPVDDLNNRIDILENSINVKFNDINTKIDRIMNMIS